MNWGTFWAAGAAQGAASAASAAKRTAREAKLQRKELEKQTQIMRKSTMSSEQIAAEENAKTARQGLWIVVGSIVLFIGACIAYPIFGIIVGVILAISLTIYFVRKKSKKKKLTEKSVAKHDIQQHKSSVDNRATVGEKHKTRTNHADNKMQHKTNTVTTEDIEKHLDKLLDMSLKGLITDEEYKRKSAILRHRLQEIKQTNKTKKS